MNFGISPAFEEIDMMLKGFEQVGWIAFGFLAAAAVACEWNRT
jgi:hypothetical protein